MGPGSYECNPHPICCGGCFWEVTFASTIPQWKPSSIGGDAQASQILIISLILDFYSL